MSQKFSQKKMGLQTWEELFLEEEKRFVLKEASPDKVSKYVLVATGVSSQFLVDQLRHKCQVGTITTGSIENVQLSVTHRYGGAIQMEILIRVLSFTKAKYLIGIGCCGALQDTIKIGDIIIPTEAVRGESTTRYYYSEEILALPDRDVLNALVQSTKEFGIEPNVGKVYTTGSLLHETEEMIKKWNKERLLAVECESSVLFLLSKYCNLKSGMILCVSDHPFLKQSHAFDKTLNRTWETEQNNAARIALQSIKYLKP